MDSRPETMKLLEEYRGQILHDTEFGHDFLVMALKAHRQQKQKWALGTIPN